MTKVPTTKKSQQLYICIYPFPSKKGRKYVKQKQIELKGKIDKSTIILGDFDIPPLNRWKNQIINQQRFHRTQLIASNQHLQSIIPNNRRMLTLLRFSWNIGQIISCSQVPMEHRIDHLLCLKTNLNIFFKKQIVQSEFSNHNRIKREISDRKIIGNLHILGN